MEPDFKPGDKVLFTSTDSDDNDENRLATVKRLLTEAEADLVEVGTMYRITFEDGSEKEAFHDELTGA